MAVKVQTQAAKAGKKARQQSLTVLEPNAAGVDVGATEHWVAVNPDRDQKPVRKFGTFTADLYAIADWLKVCEVRVVALESTGVYWIPLYTVLIERGFAVDLVDARHTKNLAGRKDDCLDCDWIRQLRSFGLLRGAFVPGNEQGVIRSYIRHRQSLIQMASIHIQHMQKALTLMNLQLHHVITDITGATGMRILQAILDGERDPARLATMRDPRVKNSAATIAAALTGHYREEHLVLLRHSFELYQSYQLKVIECDQKIVSYLKTLPTKLDTTPLPQKSTKTKKRQRNEPTYDARYEMHRLTGVDLTRIDGIHTAAAQIIISEIGWDMSPWKTERHFAAWTTLAPNHQISGGKILRRRPKRTPNRFALTLRLCAQSLLRSDSALGAYARRICGRIGTPKGLTAVAHKLARLIYRMLKYGADYVDRGQQHYNQQYQERLIKNLRRKAAELGMVLSPNEPIPSLMTPDVPTGAVSSVS